jgi:antigen flippase
MASTSYPNELAVLSSPAVPEHASTKTAEKHSYDQILKSSVVVGGSSFLNVAIGIIRTKAMAMLLGPAGFGLFGLYSSVSDLTQSVAGLGVNSSGVRQIAESVGTGDESRIARTAAVLRRTSILLGALGAIFLVAFCRPISNLTFGSTREAASVSLLSLAVLLRLISAGQGALIQGMRRIVDLAKMSVLGAAFGVCTSIPLVYFFREKGVVPSLVSVAAMTMLTSWWYSRKIYIQPAVVTFFGVGSEASALLKLGCAFMASSLMTLGVAYFVRITVLHKIGFEATGLYQAAWTLGGVYVGFILQAMGADFYPRLTASAGNNAACNRLVNEQIHVGMLLAGPGVIATLTFAPLVITLLYSAKFVAAVSLLRWITLGVTLQVITWPMGFIIVAKGRQNLFFVSEFAWTIVAVGLAWFCIRRYGLNGAGIAFFGSYIFHGLFTYPLVLVLSNFHWSVINLRTAGILSVLIVIVFSGFYILPFGAAVAIGSLALTASCIYSVWALSRLAQASAIASPVKRFLRRLGMIQPADEALEAIQ